MNNISTILVIGDIILDSYCFGNVSRISPEAPVPVLLKKAETDSLGGAANVAGNLVAAGVNVHLASVIGKDEKGSRVKKLLSEKGINSDLIIECTDRMTTQKSRYLTPSGYQLLRVDDEVTTPITEENEDKLISMIDDRILNYSVIVFSDYLKGVLTSTLMQRVIKLGKENNIPVLVDIKDRRIEKYKDAFLLKPNRIELKEISGMPVESAEQVESAARSILKATNCEYVLVTLGGEGMMLVTDKETKTIPSIPVEVYDVSGAGDTAMAYLAASIGEGLTVSDSTAIANYAASIQVSKVGTSVVSRVEVDRLMRNVAGEKIRKVVEYSELERIRKENKSVVFTNGCFDILHIGHIRYLESISKLGDILVVGINSDESVRRLKGPERPINCVSDRVEMLSAYSFIDYIVVFDEDTPIEIIKALRPDILAKGADYKRKEDVVGWDVVTSYGGKVVLADYIEGKSTSSIVSKIRTEK